MHQSVSERRNIGRSLIRLVPGIRMIQEYPIAWLPADLAAGVTLGTVMIPVGLAFGQLAGLPMAGLYTAIFPLLAYALFGSSRQLIVGPDATMATLVAVSVAPLAAGDASKFAFLAGALAVFIGMVCILGAICHLGFMADFLAKQVATGYMHGLAIIIFVGQLGAALDIKITSDQPISQLLEAIRKSSQTNWATLIITAFCVAVILIFQRWVPRIPGQIVAIVLSTAAVSLFHLERLGVGVVGRIPSGIPHFRVPVVSAGDCWSLLTVALAVTLLAFSDTMVTVRAFASRNHYQVDTNQEMLALGVASISSGLFQGLPLSSSGSRTAVAESAGSRSQITSVVAAIVVAAALSLMTLLFRDLPNSALAGVLIVAAYNLCNFPEWRRMWRFRGIGFAAAALTLIGMIVLGVMQGIAIGVVFCIIMLLKSIAFPKDAVLGRVANTGEFNDVARHPDAQQIPGVLIYRFSGPPIFANCSRFSARVEDLVKKDNQAAILHHPRTI
jgi:SulP family sulfate permease